MTTKATNAIASDYQLTTLSNQARLLQIPMPSVQSVTVLALVNAGRRYEPEQWAGISHFLEHMVFKGTAKYANSQELSAEIDRVGGEFNAFTSKEYTGYYVKLASRYTDLALEVVSEMLCTPKLRASDIKRESQVIIEEINMYEDLPMHRISDVYDEMLFAGTNLAGNVLGTKEVVSSLQRKDFLEYINEWYGFKNVVIVVAGDEKVIKDAGFQAKVEEYFSKGGQERQAHDHQEFWQPGAYSQHRKSIVSKETEQARFILGLPAFDRYDQRKYSLSVLSTLLGKTMSSRLFTQIRDKLGLCYYIRSGTDHYHDVGTFAASAGVDPRRINEAIQATKLEFEKLLDQEPPTAMEVQAAKQNMIGRFLLQIEDSQSVASWMGMKLLLENKVVTPAQIIKEIESVDLDKVKAVVQALIKPEEWRLALIGPYQADDIKFE